MGYNELGSTASILGFFISIATLIYAAFVNNKIKKLHFLNIFNKTIDEHMKNIDDNQKKLATMLGNIEVNIEAIKEIFSSNLTIFESLGPKIEDKNARKNSKMIVNRIEFINGKKIYNFKGTGYRFIDYLILHYQWLVNGKIPSLEVVSIYKAINENYNRIEKVKLDYKHRIK